MDTWTEIERLEQDPAEQDRLLRAALEYEPAGTATERILAQLEADQLAARWARTREMSVRLSRGRCA